jgi:hypothetical protein
MFQREHWKMFQMFRKWAYKLLEEYIGCWTLHIYFYKKRYIMMCVCVCVCEREKKKKKQEGICNHKRKWKTNKKQTWQHTMGLNRIGVSGPLQQITFLNLFSYSHVMESSCWYSLISTKPTHTLISLQACYKDLNLHHTSTWMARNH